MEILYFVFGAVAMAVVAFVALVVVMTVMTIKTRKEFKDHLVENREQQEFLFDKLVELKELDEENYKKAVAHTDKRVDQLASQLNK